MDLKNTEYYLKLISHTDISVDGNFVILISLLKDALQLSVGDLARRFGSTKERINDWFEGSNLPKLEMRNIILNWFIDKL